jgi:TatA/E family protein of Tat protein translocase
MGNIGSSELLLILILALLLLGPRRLPEVGAALGRTLRRFRQASRELRDEIDVERSLRLDDVGETPRRNVPPATQARETRAAGESTSPDSPASPNPPASPASPPDTGRADA